MHCRSALPALVLACATSGGARPSALAPALSDAEQAAAARIHAAEISGHLRFLAGDLLEGRSPGTRGSALAIAYLASQLQAAGLVGGQAEGGRRSFLQRVPLVKLAARVPPSVEFRGTAGPLALATTGGAKAELVLEPNGEVAAARLHDAELVFAGYGIVAPEYGWDDYKDIDVRGKVVVLLNFNPPFAGERVRLWYGRWDYKFQTAAAHGAAGALIVHTTESAGYPWQVLSSSADGVGFTLPAEGEPTMQFQGWLETEAARRLFAGGGRDLEAMTKAAQAPASKGTRPQPLGVSMSLDMPVDRSTTESANVLGLVPGTDPQLSRELVVFTAHHDHLGMVTPVPPATDGIYNGALDNASGCAALLAMARAAAAAPPRRSLLFAFVTAEEQGLLGSRYLAQHPPVPAGRIAANINTDSINRWGLTSDVGLLGKGKSSLDAIVEAVASAQGRTVHGDPFPDRGSFYRSDQFELARMGVPVVYAEGGPSYVGRPAGWGKEQREEFEDKHYHQPSDEYPPYPGAWDLSGGVQDAQLQLIVGLRVADAPELPSWTPGDEFEKARKSARKE
jgi:hypothetical protein